MKIKLVSKDKGLAPPKEAFDFRPNRTVDSNPKLDNMKGDYVSPKNRKKRKYYIGGDFMKYKVDYSPINTEVPKVTIPNLRKLFWDVNPTIENKEPEEKNTPPVYALYWSGNTPTATNDELLTMSLPELLTLEKIPYKVSSGFRLGALTKQGVASNHSKGDKDNPGAYDIVPTSGTFDEFELALYSNPRILSWLELHNWGTLREDATQGKARGFIGVDGKFHDTGASGPHFHFGPDSHAVKWREANKKKYAVG